MDRASIDYWLKIDQRKDRTHTTDLPEPTSPRPPPPRAQVVSRSDPRKTASGIEVFGDNTIIQSQELDDIINERDAVKEQLRECACELAGMMRSQNAPETEVLDMLDYFGLGTDKTLDELIGSVSDTATEPK
jgi:hypothetical protein